MIIDLKKWINVEKIFGKLKVGETLNCNLKGFEVYLGERNKRPSKKAHGFFLYHTDRITYCKSNKSEALYVRRIG